MTLRFLWRRAGSTFLYQTSEGEPIVEVMILPPLPLGVTVRMVQRRLH